MKLQILLFVILFCSFTEIAVSVDYYMGATRSTLDYQDGGILMIMPSILASNSRNDNACYLYFAEKTALARYKLLKNVSTWFYFLGFEPTEITIQQVVSSTYDMVVMEPIFTDVENINYPIESVVTRFHHAAHSKLVLAYVDIGQAEDWRTYWQDDWDIGTPSWIVADDPDGWEGNYPVKYWHPDWKNIWIGTSGYLQKIVDAGFDGIYLDWVEAYSDENIHSEAELEGKNAAELTDSNAYLAIVDGIAQEQTWFDGSADNTPPGDCPLPATDSAIETTSYEQRLKDIDQERKQTDDGCYTMYVDYPKSTLHVSSEEYLRYLTFAHDNCEIIFTVDYTLLQQNIDEVYTKSQKRGFIPYTSERNLGIFTDPVTQ